MSATTDQQEANKRAAQQVFDVWDGGEIDTLDDVLAEDLILHGHAEEVVGTSHGREAYKDNLRMLRAGLPDLFFEVNEVVAEDDTVIAHCTIGGTHEGDLLGIEPTGNSVEAGSFGRYRFDDGKLVEVIGLPRFIRVVPATRRHRTAWGRVNNGSRKQGDRPEIPGRDL